MRLTIIHSGGADYHRSLRMLSLSMNLFGIFLDKPTGYFRYPALAFTWLTFFIHLGIGTHYFCGIIRKTSFVSSGLISYVLDNLSYNISIAAIHWLLITRAGTIQSLHSSIDDLENNEDISRKTRFRTYSALALSVISVEVNYLMSILNGETAADIGLSVMQKYFYPSYAFGLFSIAALTLADHLEKLGADLADLGPVRADQLDSLQRKHLKLIKIKENLADCFGPFLLIGISDLFIRLISFCYYEIVSIRKFFDHPAAGHVWILFCCVECFFRLYVVCYAADKLHDQVTRITTQLFNVQMRVNNQPELSNKMQAFILQSFTASTDITAAGFFNINKRIIVALLSTTITYTIVLMQLPKEAELQQ